MVKISGHQLNKVRRRVSDLMSGLSKAGHAAGRWRVALVKAPKLMSIGCGFAIVPKPEVVLGNRIEKCNRSHPILQ